MFYRHKSKAHWIKGDKNTRFFHHATIIRWHRNQIHVMRDADGQWVEGDRSITQEFVSFKSRWSISMNGDDSFTLGEPPSLVIDAENQELTKLVSTEGD